MKGIQQYHFLPRKYGKELLVDIARMETLPGYVLDATPHQLSFYEIALITSGTGIFYLDHQPIPFDKNTVIFTSPGQVRIWEVQQNVSGYTFFFEKDFLQSFFRDDLFLHRFHFFHQYNTATFLKLEKHPAEQCEQLLQKALEEIQHLQSDSHDLLRAILYHILILLNRQYADRHTLQRSIYTNVSLLQFRQLLEQQYTHHQRVSDYAALLQVTPMQLNKLCKKYSGQTAQQLIHGKILSEARRLLIYSNYTIAEIGYGLNFSDPANFNRFFKRLTGISPQQYRQEK